VPLRCSHDYAAGTPCTRTRHTPERRRGPVASAPGPSYPQTQYRDAKPRAAKCARYYWHRSAGQCSHARERPLARAQRTVAAQIVTIAAMRAIPGEPLGSQFDNFLYAPIAEESNGMLLRVVSVLARSNLDPWEEASRLAHLPADTAIGKLAALIASMPGAPTARPNPRTTAALLIPLLPRPIRMRTPGQEVVTPSPSANKSRALTSIVIYALVMLFLLCAQWLLSKRDSPDSAQRAQVSLPGAPAPPSPRPPG